MSAPIVLVPGFWLGAWAWDGVVAALRADGHNVTALTLPGLESAGADRSTITLEDHIEAIAGAVRDAGAPAVLAVHSGAAVPGYAASDRVAERLAGVVYVDTFPSAGGMDPEFKGAELPLPSWEELTSDPYNSLEGITPEQLEVFRRLAVPEPAAALRDRAVLTNDARHDVPSTVVCTAMTSAELKKFLAEGPPWLAALAQLRHVTYVDLPTSHWSMWTRPIELARIIGDVAAAF